MGLVSLWHIASTLACAYFLVMSDAAAACSFGAYLIVSCGLYGQFVAYRHSPKLHPPARRNLILIGVSCLCVLLTAALIGILMEMMLAVDSAVTHILGSIMPTVLFGAGFLPQFYEFISSWSVEGFSFGLTAMDTMGCACNTVSLFGKTNPLAKFLEEASPFLMIIVMQLLVVTLALVITRKSVLPKDGSAVALLQANA
eukprot:CAMPEP_0194531932 /NCGR_PEP_ID=MMETSP0253-20130528/69323_1 /TAXON_ID=2966 /ORGANISM="Noctiluca scintillans" /LENGTH=198 /DNA_ID=CAMNT_0039377321 /DNA_START=102 /DNA_END=698 /DNA_ORIENTATION=+